MNDEETIEDWRQDRERPSDRVEEEPSLDYQFATFFAAWEHFQRTFIVDLLVPTMRAMITFVDAIEQEYIDAGAPYGETNEGLLRWLKEKGENYAD